MVLMNLIDEYSKFYIFKLYIFANTLLHLFQKVYLEYRGTARGIYKPYQVSVPFVTLILMIIMYLEILNHLFVFCWR